MKNKAFIFDWSGTLSNNFNCFCRVCNLIFQDLGKEPISKREIKLNFTLPYMKFWNKYIPDLAKEKEQELYEKYIHKAGEPKLFKQVDQIIKDLYSQGYKIFILSSDPISKLMPEIEKSGLSFFLEKVIGDIHEKGEVIASLVNEFNLDQKNTFYVGDTSGDIAAGKSAGVKTVGISWGFQHKKVLAASRPDFLIDDIVEIKDIVLKIKS